MAFTSFTGLSCLHEHKMSTQMMGICILQWKDSNITMISLLHPPVKKVEIDEVIEQRLLSNHFVLRSHLAKLSIWDRVQLFVTECTCIFAINE